MRSRRPIRTRSTRSPSALGRRPADRGDEPMRSDRAAAQPVRRTDRRSPTPGGRRARAHRPGRPDRPRLTRRWRASRSCSPAGRSARAFDPVAGGNVPVARRRGDPRPHARPGRDRRRRRRSTAAGRPASHFTFPMLLDIAAIAARRRSPTRRSTARSSSRARTRSRRPRFCWDLVLDGPKPVVVTGAMRASDDAGLRRAGQPARRGPGRGRSRVDARRRASSSPWAARSSRPTT